MPKTISEYIDYTILKPDTVEEDIIRICNEAKENGCASVCINPYYVGLAKSLLRDTKVKVCTVVGFPLGATISVVKTFEAKQAIQNGADEIDMVINIGALKDRKYDVVKEDILAVLEVCRSNNILLKVIIETCLLTDEEKKEISKIIVEVGADFVKTSTGFSTKGAEIEDIKLIKQVVEDKAYIKAAGGIRDYETACRMIKAGADRIGASKLIKEEEEISKSTTKGY